MPQNPPAGYEAVPAPPPLPAGYEAIGSPSVQQSAKPGAGRGFYDMTVGPLVDLGHQLSAYYSDPANKGKMPGQDLIDPEHPINKVLKSVVKGMNDEWAKAHAHALNMVNAPDLLHGADEARQMVGHGVASLVPGLGPAAAKAGEDYADNPSYAAGEVGGLATSVLAPKIVPKAIDVAAKVPDAAVAVGKSVSSAAKVTGQVLRDAATSENIGTAAGGAAGAYAGHLIGDPMGLGAAGGYLGRKIGKGISDAALEARSAAKVATAMTAEEKAAFMQESEAHANARDQSNAALTNAQPAEPVAPAATPAAPQLTPLQQRFAFRDQRLAATAEARAAAAQTAPASASVAPPEQPPPTLLTKLASRPEVQKMLDEALGGKPLQRNVPLRQQLPGASSDAAAASSGESPAAALPEGFTPLQSSALSGYKYDPVKSEFESITKGGQHYIHGDVSPEEAAAFEDADSKGKAWQLIRNNPLVAKVINGKRIPIMKSGAQAAISAKAANLADFIRNAETPRPAQTAADSADLTSQLQTMLDQVQAARARVNARKAK